MSFIQFECCCTTPSLPCCPGFAAPTTLTVSSVSFCDNGGCGFTRTLTWNAVTLRYEVCWLSNFGGGIGGAAFNAAVWLYLYPLNCQLELWYSGTFRVPGGGGAACWMVSAGTCAGSPTAQEFTIVPAVTVCSPLSLTYTYTDTYGLACGIYHAGGTNGDTITVTP